MTEEPQVKEGEKYCFKCKKIVDKKDYHDYYDICWNCVKNSRSH